MTRQRDLKEAIRERMARTGERYTAARAMVLKSGTAAAASPRPIAGAFDGYDSFGGLCRDTGALRNALAAVGVTAPHSQQAPSEAVVSGLCGGVGFLYAVFEYRGMPPLLSILGRYDTMPDAFVAGGLGRLEQAGLRVTTSETTSASTARKALDAAIAARTPALCVVDCVALMAEGEAGPLQMAGMAPTVVAVAGVDGDALLIDDGGAVPRRMSHDQLARARASYKKGRNRLFAIARAPGKVDLAAAVRAAIADTAHRYTHAPYKGFASNMGFAGLEKWQRLLTDAKDKKGWPALFPDGKLAYLALRRAYDGIEHEFTPPAAGRPLYAEFLDEAVAMTGSKALRNAADAYRRAGAHWAALSGAIATCGDPAIAKGCTLGDSARELIDEAECRTRDADAVRIARERLSLAQSCKFAAADMAALRARLAPIVGAILLCEREAVTAMAAASG